MKIYRKNQKIIFEIPAETDRYNPYMDEVVGKHDTLMGLINYDTWGNIEMGFVNVIDMDYKGKDDQWTDFVIHVWDREEKEFIQLCHDMHLNVVIDPSTEYVQEECKEQAKGLEELISKQ